MDTKAKLIGIKFDGLPNIDWHSVLKRRVIELECNFVSNNVSRYKYIRPFVSKELQYTISRQGSNILTIQENYSGRNSYENQMNAVRSLQPVDSIQLQKYHNSFHIYEGIKLSLAYIPSWRRELKKYGYKGYFADALIQALVHIYLFYKRVVKRINPKEYNLLLTFYDSSLCEGFMVEFFKYYNIKTATLQHGMFTAFREKELINSGVELRTFHSDYFLCWNRFTMREAQRQGCNIDKFVICGILGYVGTQYVSCNKPSNKTFGVVIGHPSFENENLQLIESANILAKHLGYHYRLKLHPSYNENHFANYVSSNFSGLVKKGIPMIDYANMVEFSICGSSSVFAELVYLNHNIIRYSDNGLTDKFRDVKEGKTFNNPKEIVNVYGEGFCENGQLELFDEVCTIKDVTNSYRKFLNSFV